jgi:hypothetical protein
MKTESAPGSNGYTVTFKKMWLVIKGEVMWIVMWIVQDLNTNSLDLKRLNFGVITGTKSERN